MSDEREKSDRRPSHRLYQVVGDGEASTWIPIGAAWPHKDEQGFNVVCDAVPLSGRMVLRAPDDDRS